MPSVGGSLEVGNLEHVRNLHWPLLYYTIFSVRDGDFTGLGTNFIDARGLAQPHGRVHDTLR